MAYGNIVGQTSEGFSKDEILTGATANKFDLSDAAVPNDVFDFLGKFNQHWWRRRTEASHWEIQLEKKTNELVALIGGTGGTLTMNYSNEVTISNNGEISLVSPTEGRLNYSGAESTLKRRQNSYITLKADNYEASTWLDGKIAYIPQNANITYLRETSASAYYLRADVEIAKAAYINEDSDWEYVTSSNRSAYPDGGEKDGYVYQYLGVPYDNIKAVPRIATGSYKGDGNVRKQMSITFDFVPKMVVVKPYYTDPNRQLNGYTLLWIEGLKAVPIHMSTSGLSNTNVDVTIEGTTIKWFNGDSAKYNLNLKNETYCYFAIG